MDPSHMALRPLQATPSLSLATAPSLSSSSPSVSAIQSLLNLQQHGLSPTPSLYHSASSSQLSNHAMSTPSESTRISINPSTTPILSPKTPSSYVSHDGRNHQPLAHSTVTDHHRSDSGRSTISSRSNNTAESLFSSIPSSRKHGQTSKTSALGLDLQLALSSALDQGSTGLLSRSESWASTTPTSPGGEKTYDDVAFLAASKAFVQVSPQYPSHGSHADQTKSENFWSTDSSDGHVFLPRRANSSVPPLMLANALIPPSRSESLGPLVAKVALTRSYTSPAIESAVKPTTLVARRSDSGSLSKNHLEQVHSRRSSSLRPSAWQPASHSTFTNKPTSSKGSATSVGSVAEKEKGSDSAERRVSRVTSIEPSSRLTIPDIASSSKLEEQPHRVVSPSSVSPGSTATGFRSTFSKKAKNLKHSFGWHFSSSQGYPVGSSGLSSGAQSLSPSSLSSPVPSPQMYDNTFLIPSPGLSPSYPPVPSKYSNHIVSSADDVSIPTTSPATHTVPLPTSRSYSSFLLGKSFKQKLTGSSNQNDSSGQLRLVQVKSYEAPPQGWNRMSLAKVPTTLDEHITFDVKGKKKQANPDESNKTNRPRSRLAARFSLHDQTWAKTLSSFTGNKHSNASKGSDMSDAYRSPLPRKGSSKEIGCPNRALSCVDLSTTLSQTAASSASQAVPIRFRDREKPASLHIPIGSAGSDDNQLSPSFTETFSFLKHALARSNDDPSVAFERIAEAGKTSSDRGTSPKQTSSKRDPKMLPKDDYSKAPVPPTEKGTFGKPTLILAYQPMVSDGALRKSSCPPPVHSSRTAPVLDKASEKSSKTQNDNNRSVGSFSIVSLSEVQGSATIDTAKRNGSRQTAAFSQPFDSSSTLLPKAPKLCLADSHLTHSAAPSPADKGLSNRNRTSLATENSTGSRPSTSRSASMAWSSVKGDGMKTIPQRRNSLSKTLSNVLNRAKYTHPDLDKPLPDSPPTVAAKMLALPPRPETSLGFSRQSTIKRERRSSLKSKPSRKDALPISERPTTKSAVPSPPSRVDGGRLASTSSSHPSSPNRIPKRSSSIRGTPKKGSELDGSPSLPSKSTFSNASKVTLPSSAVRPNLATDKGLRSTLKAATPSSRGTNPPPSSFRAPPSSNRASPSPSSLGSRPSPDHSKKAPSRPTTGKLLPRPGSMQNGNRPKQHTTRNSPNPSLDSAALSKKESSLPIDPPRPLPKLDGQPGSNKKPVLTRSQTSFVSPPPILRPASAMGSSRPSLVRRKMSQPTLDMIDDKEFLAALEHVRAIHRERIAAEAEQAETVAKLSKIASVSKSNVDSRPADHPPVGGETGRDPSKLVKTHGGNRRIAHRRSVSADDTSLVRKPAVSQNEMPKSVNQVQKAIIQANADRRSTLLPAATSGLEWGVGKASGKLRDGAFVNDEDWKKEVKALFLIRELVQTERSYVRYLISLLGAVQKIHPVVTTTTSTALSSKRKSTSSIFSTYSPTNNYKNPTHALPLHLNSMLTYLPQLIALSRSFISRVEENPTSAGVGASFEVLGRQFESVFVNWSAVVPAVMATLRIAEGAKVKLYPKLGLIPLLSSADASHWDPSFVSEEAAVTKPTRSSYVTEFGTLSPSLSLATLEDNENDPNSTCTRSPSLGWRKSMVAASTSFVFPPSPPMSMLSISEASKSSPTPTMPIHRSTSSGSFNPVMSTTTTAKCLTPMDIVIMPTQRIPRYNLMLRNLLSNTPPLSLSHARVKRALDLTQRIAALCDEASNPEI